ncbi:MAG: LLM class flavin-dependent oxidoreductase [Bryobacterales bacterium]|nr:LLM class flavin-dependent oxidoreductase [Bryobacterales bacterium]
MKAVFVGNGTLLVQCAETYLAEGGAIVAVSTEEPRIAQWAAGRSIPVLSLAELEQSELAFDYLFSVANLKVLPDALLERAARVAINFHDGPLPAYAGLNAPAWALLSGESRHGISWHQMTSDVDGGGIYASRSLAIDPEETSFSINAKCYEAGLQAFAEMAPALLDGRAEPRQQVGERSWFGKSARPATLGVLDFQTQDAELVARQVRALDFGSGYENPLAAAKLWTGEALLLVGKAQASTAVGRPGEVLAADLQGLTIACRSGAVTLSGFRDLAGQAVTLAIGVGAVLTLPPLPDEAERTAVGKAESRWGRELDQAAPVFPPYPTGHAIGAGWEASPLTGEVSTASVLAFLAGLAGRNDATIAYATAPASPVCAFAAPLTVEIAGTPAELQQAVADKLAAFAKRGPMAADLHLRLGDADAQAKAVRALSVVVCAAAFDQADLPPTAQIVLDLAGGRVLTRSGLMSEAVRQAFADALSEYAARFASAETAVADIPLAAEAMPGMSRSGEPFERDATIQSSIAVRTAATPDAPALEAGDVHLTFAELDRKAAAFAGALAARGAKPGEIIGLCLERSVDLVVALLGILKTGAAYLPLDPSYPADRIAYMVEDSGCKLIVASPTAASRVALDPAKVVSPSETGEAPLTAGSPDDLAYLIYTSGSTGKPKGVMVLQRNVTNFFAGMDDMVPHEAGKRLLAVTSISFDISVLEIFWALSRGLTVVLQTDGAGETKLPAFSLFYFASEASGSGHHAYRLLLEGAKFADENGFEAVWNPERHFHAFGGLYPNPAISLASVAGFTKNVKLRAGSCVLPLHHPVRAAEDWALLDNLSNGRAGIALASGWQPNDFILRPENFEKRKDVMLENVETLRALWRGETLEFPNHKGEKVKVEVHPRPVKGKIPLWLTAAGNPETFAAAARLGCGVLTHLLGQTFEEVAEKIKAYRVAWRQAGHPGVGTVTLMLHTFVGEEEDAVREVVREPMKGYLKSATDLIKRASWSFPTFVQKANAGGVTPLQVFENEDLTEQEMAALLDHAFERYYRTSGLFGTPESCKEIVRNVAAMGVDEIACLIDFGVDIDLALANLPNIKRLMKELEEEGNVGRRASVAEHIVEGDVTHLQCTPSMASFLVADAPGRAALGQLEALMVGGEALPPDLAASLRQNLQGELLNMYGPTETTVWSSVAKLDTVGAKIPLGKPIVNTVLSVRNDKGRPLPACVAGELWIGGEGVTAGYFRRPELTAERFVEGGKFYRTGDLVRILPDATIEFLGRIDNQVKIRGHRIELGEIEAAIAASPQVKDAVVSAVEEAGDKRLVAYVTAAPGAKVDPAALRKSLSGGLPDFMIPSQVVVLDRMPLTPNGKVDRKALPSPSAQPAAAPAAAAGGVEETIQAIWREALGLAEVGVTENFFDLGGHSLLVVQVQRKLKEATGEEIALTDMFRFPTIRSLAEHLSGAAAEQPSAQSRGAARAAARLARRRRA